jgi:hypothetical protein
VLAILASIAAPTARDRIVGIDDERDPPGARSRQSTRDARVGDGIRFDEEASTIGHTRPPQVSRLPLGTLVVNDWLWSELHYLFDTDDGSLPRVLLNYQHKHAVVEAFAYLRALGTGRDVTSERTHVEPLVGPESMVIGIK